MRVRRSLWATIKKQARWEGWGTCPIAYDDPPDAPADAPRYHPFELRLFGGWALDDPALEAPAIENATNAQYVEMRILSRLRDPALERVLPLIALCRHVDEDAVRMCAGSEEEGGPAFSRLRQQDWISEHRVTSVDGEKSRIVADAEAVMCKRLLSYYAARPADLEQVRQSAAADLIARAPGGNKLRRAFLPSATSPGRAT